jgi:hypothetical protein
MAALKCTISDEEAAAEFAKIDVSGGGKILFEEVRLPTGAGAEPHRQTHPATATAVLPLCGQASWRRHGSQQR